MRESRTAIDRDHRKRGSTRAKSLIGNVNLFGMRHTFGMSDGLRRQQCSAQENPGRKQQLFQSGYLAGNRTDEDSRLAAPAAWTEKSYSDCWLIFSRTPTLASMTNSDDPP